MNTQHYHQHQSLEMETCIQNCEKCHHICTETLNYCLQMGGQHADPVHIRLLQDCIQICQTSADFMLRGSTLHGLTCGICAEICNRCAEDCERIDPNDETMKACAAVCRQCAEACREMATAMMYS